MSKNEPTRRLKSHRRVLVSLAMQSIPSSDGRSAVAFAAGYRPGMTVACSGPESSFESIRQFVHHQHTTTSLIVFVLCRLDNGHGIANDSNNEIEDNKSFIQSE